MKKKMDVWTAIAKTMASEGVRYIFGYPGAGRFYQHGHATPPELSLVLCRDESAASFMAMGYAMATGKLGGVREFSNSRSDDFSSQKGGLLLETRQHQSYLEL
ncbi:unnamed protein product, partial [marine sediment metagenome]